MVVWYAATFMQRMIGMLGGKGSKAGECLVIAPCCDIHTLGMRWEIDVAFVSVEGRVLMARRRLAPFRRVRCKGAFAVVERRAQDTPWFGLGESLPCEIDLARFARCGEGGKKRRQTRKTKGGCREDGEMRGWTKRPDAKRCAQRK